METREIYELARELPTYERDEFLAKLKCIRRFLAEEKLLIWYAVKWMKYNSQRNSSNGINGLEPPQYMLLVSKHLIEFGLRMPLHSLFLSPININYETTRILGEILGRLNQLYHYNYENTPQAKKKCNANE